MASLPPRSGSPLILIVDDSEDTRFVYARFLEYGGFDAVTAVDAKAAMASMVPRTPDVIVMDFSLPGMDGLSATRLLKRDPQTTHVPIIILTGTLISSPPSPLERLAPACSPSSHACPIRLRPRSGDYWQGAAASSGTCPALDKISRLLLLRGAG